MLALAFICILDMNESMLYMHLQYVSYQTLWHFKNMSDVYYTRSLLKGLIFYRNCLTAGMISWNLYKNWSSKPIKNILNGSWNITARLSLFTCRCALLIQTFSIKELGHYQNKSMREVLWTIYLLTLVLKCDLSGMFIPYCYSVIETRCSSQSYDLPTSLSRRL